MKTKLLFFISTLLIASHLTGQADVQWLINNSKGKNGLKTDGITNSYVNTPIGPNFTLSGVKHAAYSITRPARADLFFIYDDGAHYNSRYLADPGFFVPIGTSLSTHTDHNFSESHSGGNIAYGYLTRSYESDDPPSSVKAASGTGGQNSTAFSFGTTQYSATSEYPNTVIRANHDVVKGRDITIIIDQFLLDSLYKQNERFDFSLVFNQIVPARAGISNAPNNNYFQTQPIFYKHLHTDQPGFPLNSFTYSSATPDRIKLLREVNKRYTYINLRPTNAIDSYGPDATGARYNAIFDIVNSSNVSVTQLAEPILQSHDPNFIRVDTIICNGSNQTVFYHFQFQNTSPTTAAATVTTGFTLPSSFDATSFSVLEYSMRGRTINTGNFTEASGNYTFTFGTNSSLNVCVTPQDITDCYGYIKFKVDVPNSVNLRNIQNSLELNDPHTIFDATKYPVDDFEDWTVMEKGHENRMIRPIDCVRDDRHDDDKFLCWILIIGGILLLILILYFILRRRDQPATPSS